MGRLVALAVILAIAPPVWADEAARDVAVLSLAAAADLASTRYALAQCPSCREANPVMSEPALSIVVKAAGVAAVAWGCGRLRRAGHPRGAKVLLGGAAGAWLGAAAWNLHKGRTAR